MTTAVPCPYPIRATLGNPDFDEAAFLVLFSFTRHFSNGKRIGGTARAVRRFDHCSDNIRAIQGDDTVRLVAYSLCGWRAS